MSINFLYQLLFQILIAYLFQSSNPQTQQTNIEGKEINITIVNDFEDIDDLPRVQATTDVHIRSGRSTKYQIKGIIKKPVVGEIFPAVWQLPWECI